MGTSRREMLKAAAAVSIAAASGSATAKASPPKVTGTIYFVCASCEDNYPEGSCFPREALRVMPGGEWICQDCYEDAPHWTYVKMPPIPDAEEWDEPDPPRWFEFAMPPKFVPSAEV